MNPEEINRKIAELCGWTEYRSERRGEDRWRDPQGHNWLVTLDYYNSLDACAQFEQFKTRKELDKYADELCYMCDDGSPDPDIALLVTISSAQRCEAFLRMHNQWKE